MGASWHDNESSHWELQELLRKKWWFCNLLWIGGRVFFVKEVPKVHCKTLNTIDSHKVYHSRTPNQLLVECQSSIHRPPYMCKPTLTIVDQSLTGAIEIQKKIKKKWNIWQTTFVSHISPILIKKLELHQLIYTSLHKKDDFAICCE